MGPCGNAVPGVLIMKLRVKEKVFPRYRTKWAKDGRRLHKFFGECIKSEGKIWIHKYLPQRSRLNTLIHEILHCLEPEWSESKVSKRAGQICKVLWKQGYRRIDKKKNK